jgi:hypothetical protein
MIDPAKLKVPVGAFMLDVTLIVIAIWWSGKLTERFEMVSRRVDAMEQIKIQPEADRRIAVIEARMADTTNRLASIESKLDRILERGK